MKFSQDQELSPVIVANSSKSDGEPYCALGADVNGSKVGPNIKDKHLCINRRALAE